MMKWFVKVYVNPFVSLIWLGIIIMICSGFIAVSKMKKIHSIDSLIIFLAICIFTLIYLISGKDPNKPPSALLNKDIPKFITKSLYDSNISLSSDNIKRNVNINTENIERKYTLINFFASWCTPCKIEHPLFFELSKEHDNLFILGINHKDSYSDAAKIFKRSWKSI